MNCHFCCNSRKTTMTKCGCCPTFLVFATLPKNLWTFQSKKIHDVLNS